MMNLHVHHRVLAAILCAFPSVVFADAPPPPPPDAEGWNATQSVAPSSVVHLGSYTLSLEETRLADVQRAVGARRIEHAGDAGDSVGWLCYTVGSGRSRAKVWMTSSEMGGQEQRIDGFIIRSAPASRASVSCPALSSRFAPIRLQHALGLGSSEQQIRVALGTPSRRVGTWIYDESATKTPGDCEGGSFDVTSGLQARIEHGAVVDLRVFKVTSC